MGQKDKKPTDTYLKNDIVTYLIKDRGMSYKLGEAPYWMYSFGCPKKEFNMTIWFANNTNDNHLPANVEIYQGDSECVYNGAIFNIDDLKRILYLIFDCYENGYIIIPKENGD